MAIWISDSTVQTVHEKTVWLLQTAGIWNADAGVPALSGTFGVVAAQPATWQLGRDSVYTAPMCALAGTDITIGLGILSASTLLVPEQIIFDDEIYHTHRVLAEGLGASGDDLALELIAAVGPGGRYLAQKHTRQHVREKWIPHLTHPRPSEGAPPPPDIRERARAEVARVLATHEPEPLDEAAQAELKNILETAAQELGLRQAWLAAFPSFIFDIRDPKEATMDRIQPIRSSCTLEVLSRDELATIKSATLHILAHVGVQFPSRRALSVFAEPAHVDWQTQTVRLSPDLVLDAMCHAPRSFTLLGRSDGTDLHLDGSASYFSTDGCGIRTVDFETGRERVSRKEDVASMARVSDHLSSIAFYWPMVSAQDYRKLAPLHEAEKCLCHVAGVQIAYDWGVPILGGAFGAQHEDANTWQHGRDSVYYALAVPLDGAEMVVGMRLLRASTLLVPEQIILDDESYHTHRTFAEGVNTSADGLALDVIANVGPRGHFLAQEHTHQHMRAMWIPVLSHPKPAIDGSPLPDIQRRARAKLDRILVEHQPAPLGEAAQAELGIILDCAAGELGQ